MSKKKDFFLKQGYSEQLIEHLEKLGVKTHMFWFLTNLTRLASSKQNVYTGEYKNLIILVNEHLESTTKNKFKTFEDAVTMIVRKKEKEERIKHNTLHTFADGHYIVRLTHQDLGDEGRFMSNCLSTYADRVKSNECCILALKNKKNETMVHFQVQRNGAISQNYEKANTSVRYKYWKYVNEFFNTHSKKINTDKFFDFGWRLHINRLNIINLEALLPTSVIHKMNNKGEKQVEIEGSSIVKKFDYVLPLKVDFTSFDKVEIIEKIQHLQITTNNIFDELLKEVEITEGKNLYLSDEIKEKLFGKNGFTLKGNDYQFNDLLHGLYGENRDVQILENAAREDIAEERGPEAPLRGFRELGRLVRQQALGRNIAPPEMPGEVDIEDMLEEDDGDGGDAEAEHQEQQEQRHVAENPGALIGRVRRIPRQGHG